MKTTLLLATVLLAAGAALADVNYNMAIQQAKRVAKNPGPSQSQPTTPAQPQAPPVNPELAATMQNIADLRTDIAALVKAEDAAAADQQRIPLMNHLSAAALGKKASSDSVKKLADDLVSILERKQIPDVQQPVIAHYLHAFFNSSHLTASQQVTLLKGFKKILSGAGVTEDDADKIANDLKTIAAETK